MTDPHVDHTQLRYQAEDAINASWLMLAGALLLGPALPLMVQRAVAESAVKSDLGVVLALLALAVSVMSSVVSRPLTRQVSTLVTLGAILVLTLGLYLDRILWMIQRAVGESAVDFALGVVLALLALAVSVTAISLSRPLTRHVSVGVTVVALLVLALALWGAFFH